MFKKRAGLTRSFLKIDPVYQSKTPKTDRGENKRKP